MIKREFLKEPEIKDLWVLKVHNPGAERFRMDVKTGQWISMKSYMISYLEQLLEDIKSQRCTLKGATNDEMAAYGEILNWEELPGDFRMDLCHQIYGGDERNRNFPGEFRGLLRGVDLLLEPNSRFFY